MSAPGVSLFSGYGRSVLPGFRLSLGFTLFYLASLVLVPLLALVLRPLELPLPDLWEAVAAPRVLASLRLSFGMALAAALIDAVFGLVIAWVLVRYRFPGKGLLDALIDLPFALPTAVAGIALSTLYAPTGWLGALLAEYGIQIAYTPWGVLVAMTFIALPFTVRTIQPVLAELGRDSEEAAATLGASRTQRFLQIVVPNAASGIVTGALTVLTLSIGEFNLTWLLHTPLTKTLPVGLADSYASMRLEIASAYTLVFLLMLVPLLVGLQWLARGDRPARAASNRTLPS